MEMLGEVLHKPPVEEIDDVGPHPLGASEQAAEGAATVAALPEVLDRIRVAAQEFWGPPKPG